MLQGNTYKYRETT